MRELARRIVRMRKLLMAAIVHELAERENAQRASLALLDAEANMLPLGLQRAEQITRLIGEPVQRKIAREGVLSQNVGGVQ